MANFKVDILKALNGEVIEAIVVGERDPWAEPRPENKRKIQTWADVREQLDYEYDDGFGGPDCHAILVWTANRVIFVSEYDGSTCLRSVPRNPTETVVQLC